MRGVEGCCRGDGDVRRFVWLCFAIEQNIIEFTEMVVEGSLRPGGNIHCGRYRPCTRITNCVQSDQISLVTVLGLKTFENLAQGHVFSREFYIVVEFIVSVLVRLLMA